MKVTLDRAARAAYITLRQGKAHETECLDNTTNIDRDVDGVVIGVEATDVDTVEVVTND